MLKHILQIDEVAVVHMLGVVIHVVEVDDALLVGLDDLLRQEDALGDVLGHLARHIVPLDGVDDRVLVGVLLLHLLVIALNEGEDAAVGGVLHPVQGPLEAVADIPLCRLIGAGLHDTGLHQLLDLLHRRRAAQRRALGLDSGGDVLDPGGRQFPGAGGGLVGLGDGGKNFGAVELLLRAAPLDNFHR